MKRTYKKNENYVSAREVVKVERELFPGYAFGRCNVCGRNRAFLSIHTESEAVCVYCAGEAE